MFLALEWKMGSRAILPLAMFKRRTQAGACLSAFFVMLMLLVGIYELPLLYQAKGHSATKSGIDILPFMLTVVLGAAGSGGVITFTGRYWWWLVISPLIGSVGAGLLFSIDERTSGAKLIGYQLLYGIGIGGTLQNAVSVVLVGFDWKRGADRAFGCSSSRFKQSITRRNTSSPNPPQSSLSHNSLVVSSA